MSSLAVIAVVAGLASSISSASAATNRVDLQVLVVDDGSVMVGAITDTLTFEGLPFTTIKLADGNSRTKITAGYLASGTEAKFESVVLPNEQGGTLAPEELTALHSYEAQFGVRQVDASTWAQHVLGQNWATYSGSTDGMTAAVTAAGKTSGFGYLKGSVPLSLGSMAYLGTPAPAGTADVPAGSTFTPLVTVPIPNTTDQGSLIGAFSSGGVEQLVIDTNYNTGQLSFRMLAHGIVTWMTRGVHFGYTRNYFTFHFDDAFAADSRWDPAQHCTPGEDCQLTSDNPNPIRMTAADVTEVGTWVRTNNYTPTLAFNGFYTTNDPTNGDAAYTAPDPLTNALVAAKGSFHWLNHGYKHIFQGCQQDFTTTPWRCVTNPAGQAPAADGSNLVWTAQADVQSEIQNNITVGTTLGLPFDPTEYLSGEHSGLKTLPQQPVDNPNYAAALQASTIKVIGADASRETGQRTVGGALTIPRHPTAIYYNVSTVAEEVSEYNWFYAPASAGGNCQAPTACMSTAVTSYDTIVNSDSDFDLRFVLSNDPRPFYAHVSNLTSPDYLGLKLMSGILTKYRAAFADSAPVLNLTETQAADVLGKQQAWATAGMGTAPTATGYIQDGAVTINAGTARAPVTVPEGTLVNGAAFGEAYAGERSGWVTGTQSLALAVPQITSPSTALFQPNVAGTFTITTSPVGAIPATALSYTGTLPAGLTFTENGNGTATIAGTPTGTAGTAALTITATNAAGSVTQALQVTVGTPPAFTSAAAATFTVGQAGTFTVATTGTPIPVITASALPAGITLTDNKNNTATLAGTPAAGTGGLSTVTLTAASAAGTVTQQFALTVNEAPSFATLPSAAFTIGKAGSVTITTKGYPKPAIAAGTLPAGLTLTDKGDGTATLGGTPAGPAGSFSAALTATNPIGTANASLPITIMQLPAITSVNSATVKVGTALNFLITSTGSPAATITVSGALPSGVTFKAGSNGTGTLSGTPVAGTARSYALTITATNAAGSVQQAFTLVVTSVPVFTSAQTATATIGSPITLTIRTSGYPTAALAVTGGTLPTGLTFKDLGNGTASLSGTPAAGTSGVYTLRFTATNVAGSATQTYTLTVRGAPTISVGAGTTATRNRSYTLTVKATGSPAPTLTRGGTLPPGLRWTLGTGTTTTATATISGRPTRAGTYTLTIRASNSWGSTSQRVTITVR